MLIEIYNSRLETGQLGCCNRTDPWEFSCIIKRSKVDMQESVSLQLRPAHLLAGSMKLCSSGRAFLVN